MRLGTTSRLQGVLTLWLGVDVLWVLLLGVLFHAESSAICVNIIKHVGVLVASQPLVFPVESQWLGTRQQRAELVVWQCPSIMVQLGIRFTASTRALRGHRGQAAGEQIVRGGHARQGSCGSKGHRA